MYIQLRTSLLFFCAVALARLAAATPKWKLSYSITSPQLNGMNVDVDPYNMPPDCNAPGVCVPFPVTLPANTLWYWCGWRAIQRTDYSLFATANISAQMMRVHALDTCVLEPPNGTGFANIANCEIIFGSLCDTKTSCTTRVLGLAFPDEVCLVVANNNAKPLNFTVQVFQYKDWPRYYGTVFSIILTIILLSGVMTYIGFTCYHEITATPDRIVELKAFEQQLNRSNTADQRELQSERNDASDPGTFQGRVKVALSKVKGLVMRGKGATQS